MEINEISAVEASQLESSNATREATALTNQQNNTNTDQSLEVLESTAPGKLRVGPVTTLGLNLDIKA